MGQSENLFTPDHIRLYSGTYFNPTFPDIDKIHIEDIAHGLSMHCRFGGHTKVFYSVAEHCINVSKNVFRCNRLAALLHDASEAYLYDVPKPIKVNLIGYSEMEDNIMRLISQKFGFEYPLNNDVKSADMTLLSLEWEKLVINEPKISVLSQGEAKSEFLRLFHSYSA